MYQPSRIFQNVTVKTKNLRSANWFTLIVKLFDRE